MLGALAATTGVAGTGNVVVSPSGPEFVVTDLTLGAQLSPGIVARGENDLVATWQGARSQEDTGTSEVWSRRVTRSAATSAEVRASQLVLEDAQSLFPAIATAPGRSVLIAWTDADSSDGSFSGIFARLMNDDLSPVGNAFQVNNLITDYNQEFPSVAMRSDGTFFIVWRDSGHIIEAPRHSIRGRVFRADGTPIEDEFVIATTADGEPFAPQVSAYQDQHFLVTYNALATEEDGKNESYDVYLRTFDTEGNGTAPVRVNTVVHGDQTFPDVAACADGRFVVVWQSSDGDADPDVGIRAQWFDAVGAKSGGELLVNSFITGIQSQATVATTPDCRAVIAWQSSDQDGDQSGIYARLVNPDGQPASDEFRVNKTTQGRQGLRSIQETGLAVDGERTFFAVWASDLHSNDDWDVVGQGFCWLADGPEPVCGNVSCSADESKGENAQSVTSVDALVTLNAAVGIGLCDPCRCDVDSSGSITSSDALRILRAAVSLPVQLDCTPCSF